MGDDELPDEFLLARRRELSSRATEKGIDWEAQIAALPQDDNGLIVVALASLLGLSTPDALDGSKSLDELERDMEMRKEGEGRPR